MEYLRSILFDAIAIFTIMNPLAAGVIMLSLLDEKAGKPEIKATARKHFKAVFLALLVLFLAGAYIFSFFGISLHALQAFGGIILLFMGFNMVQGHGKRINHQPKEHEAAKDLDDISVVPLAIPVTVGPGLATTLVAKSAGAADWQDYAVGVAAILISSLGGFLILRRMPYIKRKLGENGLKVFNRLMGLVVGSLGAQMIMGGIRELLEA